MHKLEQSIYTRQPNVNFRGRGSLQHAQVIHQIKWVGPVEFKDIELSPKCKTQRPDNRELNEKTNPQLRLDWEAGRQAGGQSDEKDDQPGQQSRDTAGAEAANSQELIPESSAITKALDYHARLADDLTKMCSGCKA